MRKCIICRYRAEKGSDYCPTHYYSGPSMASHIETVAERGLKTPWLGISKYKKQAELSENRAINNERNPYA